MHRKMFAEVFEKSKDLEHVVFDKTVNQPPALVKVLFVVFLILDSL